VPLQQYLTLQFGAIGLDQIVYGLLFLIILLVLPEGIVPSLERQWRKRWPPSRNGLEGVKWRRSS
jgi:branched-chain amino acid transport system permease protein